MLEHERVGGEIDQAEHQQKARHPHVHGHGHGHEHRHADDRRQMIAHEGEPQPEQTVRALLDGTDHRPGPFAGVIAERQRDGLLEGSTQRDQPPPVSQPVGCNRHHHAGEDAKQAESGPHDDDREGSAAARQGIDHPAPEHRFGEQDEANRDVGRHQPRDQRLLGGKQA